MTNHYRFTKSHQIPKLENDMDEGMRKLIFSQKYLDWFSLS